MTELNKIKENWFDFGISFIYLANLACVEIQKKSPKIDWNQTEDLYIATIYNIKHGIEVILKSLIVVLEEKQISKKLEHHNQEEILKELYRLIREKGILNIIKKLIDKNKGNKNWIFENKEEKEIFSIMDKMSWLVSKYHKCDFLKDKIQTDFIIEDTKNTAFKYPQNNILIKLDYKKIIKKINNTDIKEIETDTLHFITYFITLNMLFKECIKDINDKKTKK